MHAKHKIVIVLPAYNEEGNIDNLLNRIEIAMNKDSIDFTVIVVDDGSTDKTAEIAKQYIGRINLILRQHKKNLGLGATIRDGFREAIKITDSHDIIVVMDADGTHEPVLIPQMVKMILENDYDIIIASRYQPGSQMVGVPFKRRALSLVASLIFRLLFPINGVRDFTTGFRAYKSRIIKFAIAEHGDNFIDQEGFQCMIDILLKLRCKHLAIKEMPFILRYDFKKGTTKMKILRTIFDTLKLIVKRKIGKTVS